MARSFAWFWSSRANNAGAVTRTRLINTKADFCRSINRERARAGRQRSEFSLIQFHVATSVERRVLRRALVEWLCETNHDFDQAGWLGRNRIGLLLPAMAIEAAVGVATRLCHVDDGPPLEWIAESFAGDRRNFVHQGFAADLNIEDADKCRPARFALLADGAAEPSPCPWWKRSMDVAAAGSGLVLLTPIFLAIAAWIKCVSHGPVFFRHQRYGFSGKPFMLWKFRSMETRNAAEQHLSHVVDLMRSDAPLAKIDSQMQFIRGGKLMRAIALDELPQLINVLRGEMSLVGPRPDVVPVDRYQPWQQRRFDVLPGITGLWQVSGKNQTTFTKMMRLDTKYVRRRCLRLDLVILLKTIPAILLG